MRSPRGFAAAICFLSALPLAVLCEGLVGQGGGPVVHFSLALGSGLLCSAISDYPAPVWARWLGLLSTGLLAPIFVVQAISELTRSRLLSEVAFQGVGQQVEGWLGTTFLLWCMTAVLMDRRGRTRTMGLITVSLAAAVRAWATVLPSGPASLEATSPVLKVAYLLPFIWLLIASRQRPSDDSVAIGALSR